MTSRLFDGYAQHLARIGDVEMWVGRHDGRWHLAVDDRAADVEETLACFDDIDSGMERARVKAWVAELLGVMAVELHRDSRQPGAFLVTVEA